MTELQKSLEAVLGQKQLKTLGYLITNDGGYSREIARNLKENESTIINYLRRFYKIGLLYREPGVILTDARCNNNKRQNVVLYKINKDYVGLDKLTNLFK